MKFYNFDEIKKHGSCIRFVEEIIGLKVEGGRCQAIWRGGKNPLSVALTAEEWYDHSLKVGGGLISLCQLAKFGSESDSTIQQAQEFLGDWLRLTPKTMTRKVDVEEGRYKRLLAEGYQERARYFYHDDNGNILHFVVKMVHTEKGKEFLQGTPASWGLGDTIPVLYNRAAWRDSQAVVIVEGEKDVETLRAWGIPATTNAGGSKKWRDEYNKQFSDKDVWVCRDNDDAGKAHAYTVLRGIARYARTMHLLCPSALPKGDVTDWRDKEGGTLEAFLDMVTKAKVITPDEAEKSEEELAVLEAKEANKRAFGNMKLEKNLTIDGEKKAKQEKPMTVLELVHDLHKRFLSFPRKIGEDRLFDHDRDTRKINYISSTSELMSWIGIKSENNIYWEKSAKGSVSKDEFFSAAIQNAIRYEGISYVPDYPQRKDIYYAYGNLPPPDQHHGYFNRLMDFFTLNDEVSKILVRSLFAAPITFKYGHQRPCWCIDSNDGQGTGKTTVIELLAMLYDCEPVVTSTGELDQNYQELIKRLLSTSGRNSRILLVDNVTGELRSPNLAQLTTGWNITGKRPYGPGEESRPNNLTCCITSNSASMNNDMASRFFFIYVKRPERMSGWKTSVMNYIKAYRFNIFADIIDILSNHAPFDKAPVTRVPEFETEIIQPMCGTIEQYETVCKAIEKTKSEANLDEDEARHVEEQVRYRLQNIGICADDKVFIQTDVIDLWFKERKIKTQDLRTHAKCNMLASVDKDIRRFPSGGVYRRSGIMWLGNGEAYEAVHIVGIGPDGKAAKVATVYGDGKLHDGRKPKQSFEVQGEIELP